MTQCCFIPGERLAIDTRTYHLRRKLAGERWQLESDLDSEIITRDEDELRDLYSVGRLTFVIDSENNAESLALAVEEKVKRDFSDYPEHLQKIAKIRLQYVREFHSGDKRDLEENLKALARQVGAEAPPAIITIRRWADAFKNGGGDIRCLIPAYSDRGNKAQRYPDRLVEIAMQELWNTNLSTLRLTQKEALSAVREAIRLENKKLPENEQLKNPGRKFLRNLINGVDEYTRMSARYGKAAADRHFRAALKSGEYEGEPLDRVEIDHTVLDLIVVDPEAYLPLGRPTITIALDRRTRCILGYHVSFDPPSYVQVMRCLAHAIKPKDYVRKKYPEIQNTWPCFGIMQEVVVDNGLEFHSKDLEAACLSLLITVRYCPVKQPWWKGAVERYFRTLNKSLIHTLPGTTFSNPNERADYNSLKQAVIAMDVLDELLHTWICDVYHQTTHRSTLRSPLSLWRELIEPVRQKLPASVAMLDVCLSSIKDRTIFHYGIELNGLKYNCTELQALRRRKGNIKVTVRWNRGDLGEVHVLDESTNRYIKVPCTWLRYAQGISLWLHNAIRRDAEQKEGAETQEKLDAAKARLRQICKDAMTGKRLATRKAAARAESQLQSKADVVPPLSPIKGQEPPEQIKVAHKQPSKRPIWDEVEEVEVPVFEITTTSR